MILNGVQIFQAVMAAAHTTTAPSFWASWTQLNETDLITGDGAGGVLNGTTDVALVTGVAGNQMKIDSVDVYNADTVAHTITFKVDVSATDRIVFKCILEPTESAHYGNGRWFTTDVTGRLRTATGDVFTEFRDEGVNLQTNPTAVNFVGQGVTGSALSGVVTVTIPGGGSSGGGLPGIDGQDADDNGAPLWVANSAGQIGIPNTDKSPVVMNGLAVFGHSYEDATVGLDLAAMLSSDSVSFVNLFATAAGIPRSQIINHSWNGAQLITPSRQSGFARVLTEITRTKQNFPFARTFGSGYFFNFGINEIGNTQPAGMTLMRSTFANCLTACISKARASAIYLCIGSNSAQWSFGANFSTSPATSVDFTSGVQTSKQATVVDSAGTSTATFKIPRGYKGEPICFNMVGLSGGSLIVTWGGTVTGTTGIIGRTDTLSAISSTAQCAYPVRFTGPINTLTAANAGQTITVRITTVSGSTFTLDGCWIESFKPSPVLVCNVNRLGETHYDQEFGDGVTTGVNTSFTSASGANFLALLHNNVNLVETDAQGAFTPKTVASVTNATTIVMSGNATGAFSNIKVKLSTRIRGYSSNYSNTDFVAATEANHSAADAHITNMNATINTVVALFGSMVQIVDLDKAMGFGETVLPANVYTLSQNDGLHPNDIGYQRMAAETYRAAMALRPENDKQDLGTIEIASAPADFSYPDRQIVVSGGIYSPQYRVVGATYTCVAGDMFAAPFFFTERDIIWGATAIEQINAPATSGSNIRIGIYDDFNSLGYPQVLRQEPTSGGAFALGTTAGQKAPGAFSTRNPHGGLYWLVFKVDSLGTTASQLATISGPSRYMPNWALVAGQRLAICWKLTGVAPGALPTSFPAGGVITNIFPNLGVTMTLL